MQTRATARAQRHAIGGRARVYDAYDWVFEAERDLQGIEKEMPPICDDPTVPFGIGPERRRRRSRSHVTDAERQPSKPGGRTSDPD